MHLILSKSKSCYFVAGAVGSAMHKDHNLHQSPVFFIGSVYTNQKLSCSGHPLVTFSTISRSQSFFTGEDFTPAYTCTLPILGMTWHQKRWLDSVSVSSSGIQTFWSAWVCSSSQCKGAFDTDWSLGKWEGKLLPLWSRGDILYTLTKMQDRYDKLEGDRQVFWWVLCPMVSWILLVHFLLWPSLLQHPWPCRICSFLPQFEKFRGSHRDVLWKGSVVPWSPILKSTNCHKTSLVGSMTQLIESVYPFLVQMEITMALHAKFSISMLKRQHTQDGKSHMA